MIDIDGIFEYSHIEIVNLAAADYSLEIIPNPFNDHFTLHFGSINIDQIEVNSFDALGRLHFYDRLNIDSGEIFYDIMNTREWSSGLYHIQV